MSPADVFSKSNWLEDGGESTPNNLSWPWFRWLMSMWLIGGKNQSSRFWAEVQILGRARPKMIPLDKASVTKSHWKVTRIDQSQFVVALEQWVSTKVAYGCGKWIFQILGRGTDFGPSSAQNETTGQGKVTKLLWKVTRIDRSQFVVVLEPWVGTKVAYGCGKWIFQILGRARPNWAELRRILRHLGSSTTHRFVSAGGNSIGPTCGRRRRLP